MRTVDIVYLSELSLLPTHLVRVLRNEEQWAHQQWQRQQRRRRRCHFLIDRSETTKTAKECMRVYVLDASSSMLDCGRGRGRRRTREANKLPIGRPDRKHALLSLDVYNEVFRD